MQHNAPLKMLFTKNASILAADCIRYGIIYASSLRLRFARVTASPCPACCHKRMEALKYSIYIDAREMQSAKAAEKLLRANAGPFAEALCATKKAQYAACINDITQYNLMKASAARAFCPIWGKRKGAVSKHFF